MNEASRYQNLTPYPEANRLLEDVVAGIVRVLQIKVQGIYLYGSTVTGDFDPAISDIDLLAVLGDDVDAAQFDALHSLHDALARAYPRWEGRIETHYIGVAALRSYRTEPHEMLVISPGEPLHRIAVRHDYLVNWYVTRGQGIAVFGPAPHTVIPPISRAEFIDVVRGHLRQWPEWIEDIDKRRPAIAYAVLTLCRALYTITHGEQTSKRRAGLWVREQMPEWATLIDNALRWREQWRDENDVVDEGAFHDAVQFVDAVVAAGSKVPTT